MPIILSCHCQSVRLELATPPMEAAECNCSICRRLGARMAYYKPDQVRRLTPRAMEDVYRPQPDGAQLEMHRCRVCGCYTHWEALDPATERVGVNVRLVEGVKLEDLPYRFIDGASW